MVYAVLSSLLWAIVNLYDKFSVRQIFTSPTQGLAIASIFSFFGVFLIPFVGWNLKNEIAFYAIIAGLLMQCSQYFYFSALEEEEVGDLVMIGSSNPVIVAIIAIPLLQKYLMLKQWIGIVLVLFAIAALKFDSHNPLKFFRRKTWYHTLCYVLCLSFHGIVVSHVLDSYTFVEIWGPYSIGMTVGGLIPFLSKKERNALVEAWPKVKIFLVPFALVEFINITANALHVYSLGEIHPALANTLANLEPGFCFLLSHFLSRMQWVPVGCFPPVTHLKKKLALVALMAIGIGLMT